MKRSVIINTSGILILIIWLFTLFLLVKREHDTSPPVNTHNVYSQSNFEEESEHWMDIFLKENKVGYAVTKIKKSAAVLR